MFVSAQEQLPQNARFALSSDSFQDEKPIELNKLVWKYQAGDDLAWAEPQFDDSHWDSIEGTRIKPEAVPPSGWNGRAWFRLHVQVDENLANKNLALIARQGGASEIYIDNQKIVEFGKIADTRVDEYNPNRLPIPFQFAGAGEHVIAVRFASQTLADLSHGAAWWMANRAINAAIQTNLLRSFPNFTKTRAGIASNAMRSIPTKR